MKFPGIIDRYIIRQFFGGFIFALALIISVAITIDVGEKMRNFVQYHLTPGQVLREYYLYFIPSMFGLMAQYFVMITVIYFTSRLANKSELIAVFNTGMSFRRFLLPYLFTSGCIAIFMWFGFNYIIPKTDRIRLRFENKYIAYQKSSTDANIHARINDSTYFYFRIYDNSQKTAYNVNLEEIRRGKLISKIAAEKAIYDTVTLTWNFHNYFKRAVDSQIKNETFTKGEKLSTNFIYDPTLNLKRWTHVQELDRDELKSTIQMLKQQGTESFKQYEVEYYKRTAKCFGIILLTIIGVVLSSKKIRGGLGLHLMFGIALGAIYEVVVKFSDSFAIKADLAPIIAVWIPNFIYCMIAVILWKKIQE